ncbi:MAG TPA: hypothetical protein V6C85_24270 [Allocoleopsis sp.]
MNGCQETKAMLGESIDPENSIQIGAQARPILRHIFRPAIGEWQLSKLLYLLPICCLLIGGGLVSCSLLPLSGNVMKIGDLQKRQKTEDRVYLQGQVTNRAPFLTNGAYRLQDSSGAIWVIADQNLPNVGDEVTIEGQLHYQSIPIGGQDLGEVYVLEQKQIGRKAGQVSQPVSSQGSPNL